LLDPEPEVILGRLDPEPRPILAKVVGSRPTLAIVAGFKSIRNLEASYLLKYIKL